MGIAWTMSAALCASLSNFFMRRSLDKSGSAGFFLIFQLFLSFIVSIFLYPIRMGDFSWNPHMVVFGFCAGVILGFMMLSLSNALKYGPPGFTFATVNAASTMPAILMAIVFGSRFCCDYSISNALGTVLVLLGLFWAGWQGFQVQSKQKWFLFCCFAFVLHLIGLAMMQWRALLIQYGGSDGLFLSIDAENAKCPWYLPLFFLGSFFVQLMNVIRGRNNFSFKHPKTYLGMFYGIFGGIANGCATFFLLLATEQAGDLEKAMIFPIYAVAVILFCNLWGQWLYGEKVHWKANVLCVVGLFIGTVNWNAFFLGS